MADHQTSDSESENSMEVSATETETETETRTSMSTMVRTSSMASSSTKMMSTRSFESVESFDAAESTTVCLQSEEREFQASSEAQETHSMMTSTMESSHHQSSLHQSSTLVESSVEMCVENGHVQEEVNGHADAATPPPQVTDSTAPDADSTAPVDDSKAPVEEKKKKKKKGTATKKVKKSASTVSKSSASKSSESSTLTRSESRQTKIHVRSVDASQVQKKFNKAAGETDAAASQLCKLCNKMVYQMERIKAEGAVWHKTCFVCSECGKKLTVDTYNSHEGKLYCKPHFKQLFQPKVVLDDDEPISVIREPIIRESQPADLPEGVVRSATSATVNHGIEELAELDLKSRFSLFEHFGQNDQAGGGGGADGADAKVVRRSQSLLTRLRRFDASGSGELVDSSDEGEDGDDPRANRRSLLLSNDHSVSFGPLSQIKARWEDDPVSRREELARQRKEEMQMLRARQCQGRQLRLREAYEQAASESRDKDNHAVDINGVDPDKVRSLKDKFERSNSDDKSNGDAQLGYKDDFHGHLDAEKMRHMKDVFEKAAEDVRNGVHHVERQEELSRIARESAKDARNLFKQMEVGGTQETKSRSSELYGLENKEAFKTTSTMLNLFRRLESNPEGRYSDDDEEEEDEDEDDDEEDESGDEDDGDSQASADEAEHGSRKHRRSSQEEELMQIAKERALAKTLREKFERWEFDDEDEKQMYEQGSSGADEIQASLKSTRNLRAHFEKLQFDEPQLPKRPHFKVNRFV